MRVNNYSLRGKSLALQADTKEVDENFRFRIGVVKRNEGEEILEEWKM